MGIYLTQARKTKQIEKQPQLVVELVGPAGAGKTAIAQSVRQSSSRIQLGRPPYFRRIGDVPFFIKNSFFLLPTLFHLLRENHRSLLSLQEIALMIILKGWPQVLKRVTSKSDKILLLDQGPIYMLALLCGFGSGALKSVSAQKWWADTYQRWSGRVNVVIWVDAFDSILVERVRAREKWHGNKVRSDVEASEFFARWRVSLEQVLSDLEAMGIGLKVVRFDTAGESVDRIVDGVCVALNLKNR